MELFYFIILFERNIIYFFYFLYVPGCIECHERFCIYCDRLNNGQIKFLFCKRKQKDEKNKQKCIQIWQTKTALNHVVQIANSLCTGTAAHFFLQQIFVLRINRRAIPIYKVEKLETQRAAATMTLKIMPEWNN